MIQLLMIKHIIPWDQGIKYNIFPIVPDDNAVNTKRISSERDKSYAHSIP